MPHRTHANISRGHRDLRDLGPPALQLPNPSSLFQVAHDAGGPLERQVGTCPHGGRGSCVVARHDVASGPSLLPTSRSRHLLPAECWVTVPTSGGCEALNEVNICKVFGKFLWECASSLCLLHKVSSVSPTLSAGGGLAQVQIKPHQLCTAPCEFLGSPKPAHRPSPSTAGRALLHSYLSPALSP